MGESLGFKQSLVAAIPWACSAFGVYYIPRIADRNPSRRVAISVMCMLAAAVGLALSAFAGPVVAIGALCFKCGWFPLSTANILDFPSTTSYWSGTGCGDRFCTTMGAFCSFLAPLIRVEVDRAMDSSIAGLMALSVITIGCALLIGLLQKSQQAAKAYS